MFAPVGKTLEEFTWGTPRAVNDKLGYVNQYGLGRKVRWLFVHFPRMICCANILWLQHIFDAVKKSLERLQLDYIDVLQCHRFDPDTPIEETMEALHDVVKAGYVRYIGMSSCYAWQCACSFKFKLAIFY